MEDCQGALLLLDRARQFDHIHIRTEHSSVSWADQSIGAYRYLFRNIGDFHKATVVALTVLEQVGQERLTLQNLDALFRNDFSTSKSGILTRVLVLVLMALPLILSASYKMFVGGSSTVMVTGVDGVIGLSGPPGLSGQWMG